MCVSGGEGGGGGWLGAEAFEAVQSRVCVWKTSPKLYWTRLEESERKTRGAK